MERSYGSQQLVGTYQTKENAREIVLILNQALATLELQLPAGAQGPSTDPASKERAEREQAKTRSGEVDKELDELNASDVELKAELARLEPRD